MPTFLVPNSNGEDSSPRLLAPRGGIIERKLTLREFNQCHNPEGPGGGQFCSRREMSDVAVGMGPHFKAMGIDPNDPPEKWYPKALKESELAERDSEVAKLAAAMRADPKSSPLEKAYAGLLAKKELEARAALEGTSDSMSRNTGSDGHLTFARQVFHGQVLDQYIADLEKTRGGPLSRGLEHPTAIFMGGVSGAGKSTLVGKMLKGADAVICDGDSFKEYLKRMDPKLKSAEAADLQRESAYLADTLVAYAAQHKMNVVVDGTMKTLGDASSGMGDHLAGRLKVFKDLGYHTEVRFVDITVEQSVQRVLHRFLGAVESGKEGRYVAMGFVRKALPDEKYGTKPRKSFFGVRDRRDLVDAWLATNGWTGKEIGRHGNLITKFEGKA